VSHPRALELLRDGIAAAKAGDREGARPLLRQAAALDGKSESAWLWLAGLAESPQEALNCLERVLALNPAHERARAAVKTARVQAGVAAAKAGDKPQARELLRAAVAHDPGNELAWLWLASVSETPPDAVACLERVLEINPANERARAGLDRYRSYVAAAETPVAPSARTRPVATRPAPAAPAWECPLCGGGADREPETCPECGALLALAEEDCYPAFDHLASDRLRAAVERLEPAAGREFAAAFHLGLACLNLGEVEQAHDALVGALRFNPSRRDLRAWLEERGLISAGPAAPRPPARRRNVLVVDDSPTIRKLVALTLERGGCQVHAAAGGYEAIDVLRERGVPDLIFLDVSMPGMDGYQLCRLLRQNPDTSRLPIIMLSGKDGFFSKVRGRMCGSTEYLTKPFEPENLLRVVEKYCPAGEPAGAARG
jgi:twitching motility two-component system response regulator PilG